MFSIVATGSLLSISSLIYHSTKQFLALYRQSLIDINRVIVTLLQGNSLPVSEARRRKWGHGKVKWIAQIHLS